VYNTSADILVFPYTQQIPQALDKDYYIQPC